MVSLHVSSYTTVRGMLLVSLADPTRSVSREHCYVGSSPTGILDQTKLEEGKGRTARSMRSFGSWEFIFQFSLHNCPRGPIPSASATFTLSCQVVEKRGIPILFSLFMCPSHNAYHSCITPRLKKTPKRTEPVDEYTDCTREGRAGPSDVTL